MHWVLLLLLQYLHGSGSKQRCWVISSIHSCTTAFGGCSVVGVAADEPVKLQGRLAFLYAGFTQQGVCYCMHKRRIACMEEG